MGWLLSRKKTSKRSRKKRQTLSEPWTLGRVWSAVQPFGVALFFFLLGVGWYFGQPLLSEYATTQSRQPVTIEQVTLADAQPWMSPSLRRQLRQTIALQLSDNPLDGPSLAQAATALAANPWVEQVRQVRRTDKGVQVLSDYRQPVAAVESGDGYYLVDANSVRLPPRYNATHLPQLRLPVITGVTAPPSDPGVAWPGDDLEAGLALSALLRDEPFAGQITRYEVGLRDDRGRLRMTLHTTAGGMVVWGLPPGREMAVERSAATKVARLNNLYASHRSIDAGGKVVEVFGGAVFVHDPRPTSTMRSVDYTWRR